VGPEFEMVLLKVLPRAEGGVQRLVARLIWGLARAATVRVSCQVRQSTKHWSRDRSRCASEVEKLTGCHGQLNPME
jgi:hypothetical protein